MPYDAHTVRTFYMITTTNVPQKGKKQQKKKKRKPKHATNTVPHKVANGE